MSTLRDIVSRIESAAQDAGYASDGGEMQQEAYKRLTEAWADFDAAEAVQPETHMAALKAALEEVETAAREQGRQEAKAEMRPLLLDAANTLALLVEALRKMAE